MQGGTGARHSCAKGLPSAYPKRRNDAKAQHKHRPGRAFRRDRPGARLCRACDLRDCAQREPRRVQQHLRHVEGRQPVRRLGRREQAVHGLPDSQGYDRDLPHAAERDRTAPDQSPAGPGDELRRRWSEPRLQPDGEVGRPVVPRRALEARALRLRHAHEAPRERACRARDLELDQTGDVLEVSPGESE